MRAMRLVHRFVRVLLLSALLMSCGVKTPSAPAMCGTPFFGAPVAQSGISNELCGPSCGCGDGGFTPEPWTPERLARLLEWRSLDAPPDVSEDPYAKPAATPVPAVCGVKVVDAAQKTYRLVTVANAEAAAAQGLEVTHGDACGACSSLADLAVFAREADLGRRVQDCGVSTFTSGLDANQRCLEQVGFTPACARIWAYNTRFTRTKCLGVCFTLLDSAYHLADGGVNACLACDEKESGAILTSAAGRTRRNTGVPSAVCQPCAEVHLLRHAW